LWPVVYICKLDLGQKKVGIYRVGLIEWETDGHSPELPRECTVECDGEDEIAGVLSDNYGWLVSDYVVVDHVENTGRE
jgi:hypothetical protein